MTIYNPPPSSGGTPGGSNTEVQFNDSGAFGGDSHFTYDKTTDVLHVHAIAGDATDGLIVESANGTDVGILGPANTANVTWYGNHNFNTVTASRAAQFGASKTLESSNVTTTELGYVSGVTSAIQTQINTKQNSIIASDKQVIFSDGANNPAGDSGLVYDKTLNNLGVDVSAPTAKLHLGAGSSAASTAPMKVTSGTNLATIELGAVEFDGTYLYLTN